jgi:hypothetical protein
MNGIPGERSKALFPARQFDFGNLHVILVVNCQLSVISCQ